VTPSRAQATAAAVGGLSEDASGPQIAVRYSVDQRRLAADAAWASNLRVAGNEEGAAALLMGVEATLDSSDRVAVPDKSEHDLALSVAQVGISTREL
jgi:hypothetical protein